MSDEGSVASIEQQQQDVCAKRERKREKEEREKEETEGILLRMPIDILWRVMPVALKKKMKVRQLIMIIGAVIRVCRQPLDRFTLSTLLAR